jgi:hypothetical protein
VTLLSTLKCPKKHLVNLMLFGSQEAVKNNWSKNRIFHAPEVVDWEKYSLLKRDLVNNGNNKGGFKLTVVRLVESWWIHVPDTKPHYCLFFMMFIKIGNCINCLDICIVDCDDYDNHTNQLHTEAEFLWLNMSFNI